MNFPFTITFRNEDESEGAVKLLTKLGTLCNMEKLGVLPGRHTFIFFETKDSKYDELKKRIVSSIKHQG